jgi:hypothetical protein
MVRGERRDRLLVLTERWIKAGRPPWAGHKAWILYTGVPRHHLPDPLLALLAGLQISPWPYSYA